MAIEYTSPSRNAESTAMQGFQVTRFTGHGLSEGDEMLGLLAADVTLSFPHQVHAVGLDHLAARQTLTDSTVTGWRYLVLAGDRAVACSEVSVGSEAEPSVLELVNVGSSAQSTGSTLQALDEVPEVQSGRYQPRMLKIPALSVFLLWLYPLDGGDHLFVALPPVPDFLDLDHIYREEELLDLLEDPVRRSLEFDDSPIGRTEG